jgi:hypothetical protein
MPGNYDAIEAARVARTGPEAPLRFTRSTHNADCSLRNGRTTCSCPVTRRKSFVRTDYAVVKITDEGTVLAIVKPNLDALTAEAQAGRMRDAMTDEQVAVALRDGWTYMHMPLRGTSRGKRVSSAESAR